MTGVFSPIFAPMNRRFVKGGSKPYAKPCGASVSPLAVTVKFYLVSGLLKSTMDAGKIEFR